GAGGGPENVAVVINDDSFASQAVANAFIELREIPAVNAVHLALGDLADFETIDVETFRERILKPTLETLDQRGLASQIDYVVYSADLPYAVRVNADIGDRKLPQMLTPTAAVNGLTYLYPLVLAKNPEYLGLGVNFYARLPTRTWSEGDKAWSDEQRTRYRDALKQLADKEYATAAQTLVELSEARPTMPHLWYNLACARARQDKADEAMQALTQAVSVGWSDATHILDDDDLTTLRQREDFQKLVKSLQAKPLDLRPTVGFRGVAGWDPNGQPVPPDRGLRYLLSTMLSVTSGRGLSVREAIGHLRRSAAADSTFPGGSVYLMDNSDIRARTRRPMFDPTVQLLQRLGVRAEVVQGSLPQGREDVIGLVAGSAGFDWTSSKSRILPGAICEHLTSFGGVMLENAGQTPLTEFLRHGAALSSGTVSEPYAIAAKFPLPMLHVSYAQGCSAAEAFYQSLSGPYQLLIVGDPLCAPWARRPVVKPPKLASPLKGKVEFPPSAEAPEGKSVARYELFVDGVRRAACREGERLQLDTTTLPDGPHEFRLVAVVADAIQTQGRAAWSDTVANHGRSVQLALDGASDVPLGQPLTLRVTASQASAIELHCRGQMLARIEQAEGQFSLDTLRLGLGQARLGAVAFLGDGKEPAAVSSLVIARVAEPPALEAIRAPEGVEWAKGISVKAADRPARMAEDSAALNWLQDLGVQPGEPIELEGYVDVQADDLYQFQFRSPRRVQMKVDDTTVCSSDNEHWKFVPVVLNSGTHRWHVTVSGDGPPQMSLRFGGPGATSIGARQFRSPREKEPGGQ
nr:hypothetical protein [Pirellulaceae bacterium]